MLNSEKILMAQGRSKLKYFWQELGRRNVLRSLAVYAGSAFIILEAVTIIFPRWGLPDWSIDLVLYLLILGALVNLGVSWIFDITPKGVQKTKPFTKSEGPGDVPKVRDSNAWKAATYLSLVVIVGLVVLNVISGGKEARAGVIDSMLILPFDNFTGDDQLEALVSGMHSMLIGDIGRISGLRVISPTTANIYRNAAKSVPEIATELDVRAVLDLDVMCLGDTICFQAKVITPFPEERLLWIGEFRAEKSQTLNLYNRITRQIAEEVKIELSPEEEVRLGTSRTVDPDALDAYLRGQYYWELLNQDSIQKALEYFQLATELDPGWADPWAGLAQAWGMFSFFEVLPRSTTLPMINKYLNRALDLDPNSAKAHFVNGINAVWREWDWEKGEQEFLRSLELNPNDALTRLYYAHLLMILQRPDESIHQADLGLILDPMKPIVLGLHGVVMTFAEDYQHAIHSCEKAVTVDPKFSFANNNLLLPYYMTGDYERWMRAWVNKVRWSDEAKTKVFNAFQEKGHIAAIEEMFDLNEKYAPEDCFMSDGVKAMRYLHLNENEKALDHLEHIYELKDVDAAYLGANPYYVNKLKDNPRFIALLKKMNLPLPKN